MILITEVIETVKVIYFCCCCCSLQRLWLDLTSLIVMPEVGSRNTDRHLTRITSGTSSIYSFKTRGIRTISLQVRSIIHNLFSIFHPQKPIKTISTFSKSVYKFMHFVFMSIIRESTGAAGAVDSLYGRSMVNITLLTPFTSTLRYFKHCHHVNHVMMVTSCGQCHMIKTWRHHFAITGN